MTVYTLASSSSGNCTVVSHGNTHVLIDAGISLRRLRNGLQNTGLTPDDLDCVLVTHDHIDHISGIKMLVKYHKTPIFSSFGAGAGLCSIMPETEPFINFFETGAEFNLGEITVQSFNTPHDAPGSVGYTLKADGKKMAYATDLGCLTDEVVIASCGADIAIIEANHDREMLKNGPYPRFLKNRILSRSGHLANSDSGHFAAMLADSGARYILLAHLSRENNTPALAHDAALFALLDEGFTVGKDIELDVAPPYTPGRMYVI